MFQGAGDEAGGEAEFDAVGDGQSLLVVLDPDGRGDGAEDLLIVDPAARVSVGDQGRLDIPARRLELQAVAAGDDAAALAAGDVDVAVGGLALVLADRRADLGVRIEGRA